MKENLMNALARGYDIRSSQAAAAKQLDGQQFAMQHLLGLGGLGPQTALSQAAMQQQQNPLLFRFGQHALAALGQQTALSQQLQSQNTMTESDYNKEKQKYSEFKVCQNPIKQSEYAYRGK